MCVQSHIKSDLSDNDSAKIPGCLTLIGINPGQGLNAALG